MKLVKHSFCIVVMLLAWLIGGGSLCKSIAAEEQIILLEPYEAADAMQDTTRSQSRPIYVQRKGDVVFKATELLSESSEQSVSAGQQAARSDSGYAGRKMMISFFDDTRFAVTVEGETRSVGNGISFRGRQDGAPFSSFSMTVTEESYIISFQDTTTGMVYKVVGDSGSGLGIVKEIDPSKIPPVYDTAPIMPPHQE